MVEFPSDGRGRVSAGRWVVKEEDVAVEVAVEVAVAVAIERQSPWDVVPCGTTTSYRRRGGCGDFVC